MLDAIRDLVQRRFPGCTIVECRRLADDETAHGATAKGAGYGIPVRVAFRTSDGADHAVVFHTARADDFGHDRRSDRAAEMLLAFDTYAQIPRHVTALDVGVIAEDGSLRSIADSTEAYLVTEWADGELYADDLRRIAEDGVTTRDLHRVDTLADYLVRLHARHHGRLATYTRAVRDLVGSGEGIFGMVDSYAADVPGAAPARLQRLEERALAWRWHLRGRQPRLARIHGDFHPFNLLFSREVELTLLDASRGAVGDPADDVTALAINYVFFALDRPGAWRRGLGKLWHRLWTRYLRSSGDSEVLEVAAPWLAWRALVIANPTWYPTLSEHGRDRMLSWIERVLDAPRFDPSSADEVAP
jgi:thiamine kinase-like enzyme